MDREEADEIATHLGETEARIARKIAWLARTLGRDAVYELVAKTFQVEQEGGMLTLDGSRRRTPGGVFFHLVREQHGDAVVRPPPKAKQASTRAHSGPR